MYINRSCHYSLSDTEVQLLQEVFELKIFILLERVAVSLPDCSGSVTKEENTDLCLRSEPEDNLLSPVVERPDTLYFSTSAG